MNRASLYSFILIALLAPLGAQADSLWLSRGNSESGLFADRTASNVGDILTILVNESARITGSISKSTDSSSSIDNSVTSFFYSGLGAIKGGEYPDVNAGSSTSSSGGGSITNSRVAITSASVMVVDRLPNGNLIIEGARELVASGETQYVIIRGIVRKDDIGINNTVMSDRIAGAQVEFIEKGAIASAQKQGWISKLLDVANVW